MNATELQEFVAWCDTAYLLLVVDPTGEIAKANDEIEQLSEGGPRSDHTELEDCRQSPKPMTSERPPQANTGTQSERFAALPVSPQALDQPCHVALLKGQPGPAGITKVTVGRGTDRDVVLKHRSLSRAHAWFEIDASGRLFLGDLNSTNHTYINGTKVLRPVEVHPGCSVRFGSVSTFIYRPQSLWEAACQQ